jgi:PAS domain S-box-containing protein
MTDLDGTISFCNDYTLAITGWSKEEVIGRPAKDLLNPQGPPQVTDEMAIAPPGGRTQPFFEGSILEKDGGRRWIQWCCTPLRDSAGRAAGFASLGEDVTELRILRAEVTRRESEVRFQSMANTAPVMIWVAGADKLCTFFNKGWLDFTGRSMEQELGNGWASGVHPEDLDRCLATYSSSFDARRTLQMEYRLRRADGEYRWVLDNALPLYREGEFAGYIGSCIDVTEQKLIEERLRASEARLMDAQRLAKVGSWERDIEADRIQWSDEILRILGLSSVAPSNFPAFLSYVHPNDREKILETDAKARSSTAPVDIEYRIIQPDGEMRFVRSIVEAIRNNQGAPVRIVGATQDITEQVKARELLRASEERLKNAERLAASRRRPFTGSWTWTRHQGGLEKPSRTDWSVTSSSSMKHRWSMWS